MLLTVFHVYQQLQHSYSIGRLCDWYRIILWLLLELFVHARDVGMLSVITVYLIRLPRSLISSIMVRGSTLSKCSVRCIYLYTNKWHHSFGRITTTLCIRAVCKCMLPHCLVFNKQASVGVSATRALCKRFPERMLEIKTCLSIMHSLEQRFKHSFQTCLSFLRGGQC